MHGVTFTFASYLTNRFHHDTNGFFLHLHALEDVQDAIDRYNPERPICGRHDASEFATKRSLEFLVAPFRTVHQYQGDLTIGDPAQLAEHGLAG